MQRIQRPLRRNLGKFEFLALWAVALEPANVLPQIDRQLRKLPICMRLAHSSLHAVYTSVPHDTVMKSPNRCDHRRIRCELLVVD